MKRNNFCYNFTTIILSIKTIKQTMKIRSFLMLMVVGCLSFSQPAQAQLPTNVPTINKMLKSGSNGLDSFKDATNSLQTKTCGYNSYGTSIQATALKNSGTCNVKAVLMSTIDGTNYLPHFGTISSANASADTFSTSNVSTVQSHIYPIDPNTHRKGYQLFWYGTGTQGVSIASTIYQIQ